MAKGIDYAWHGTINWDCLVNSGVHYICRYFSFDPSKDLSKSELDGAMANGIEVAVVWETTANRMLSGYNGGVADAKESKNRANNLGIGTIPIYFACDWDASESEQSTINAYLDGCVSILGKARVGMYAGYWPLKRAFDAGKMTYGWQTYAWSGGNQDSRMHLYQYHNGVTVCGISADWDESKKSDFGQWPRPSSSQPPTTETDYDMTPAVDYYEGKRYVAYVDTNGRACMNGGVIDAESNVKGGLSLAIDQGSGKKTVCYVNDRNKVCVYQQNKGTNTWQWDDLDWSAKA